VSLDIEKIGIAVRISLLSRVQAEIYVISYPLPVLGRHRWFFTHPDKRQYLDQSSRVARYRKHRYSRWNCIANTCACWDLRYFLYTSGSRQQSLITHPPQQTAVFALFQSCCLISETLVWAWEFCWYHVYKMRYTLIHIYFRFQAAIFNFPPTLMSSCTNVRSTMLFDAKDMPIPLKCHIYSICNVRFKWFRFHVRHFDFRSNSHRIVHRAMLLPAAVTWTDFGILKNKCSNVEYASKGDLRPLIQWSPSLSHFH